MKTVVHVPPTKTVHQLQAMDSYSRGEYGEAIDLFKKALEESESAECWNDLGCSQAACKQYDEAAASLRRAMELDHFYGPAPLNLGALLVSLGRCGQAIPVLDRAREVLGLQAPPALAQLIEDCLKESRRLTDQPFCRGARLPRILCLVTGFVEHRASEANSREARTLFQSLRECNGELAADFASIELRVSQQSYNAERQVHILPPAKVSDYIRESAHDILHVYSPLIPFPIPTDHHLRRQPTVLTLTSNDPIETCTEDILEEVRHRIDFGRLAIVCQSAGSLARLERKDIPVAAMIPPVVDLPAVRTPAPREFSSFVVGFATAPFIAGHWEPRGIPLLLDLAARSPETQFLLAWRTAADPIRAAIAAKNLKNVAVLAGQLDMEAFYDQVDAIILPFGKSWGNHACPLSAVEGMLRGKPVLATEYAGIASWLQSESAGVVTPPSVDGLRAGLVRIQSEHREFSRQARRAALCRFDPEASVAAYRRLYSQLLEKHKGPTLEEWQSRVHARGASLVRGRAALSDFYTRQPVAETYMEERFSAAPFRKMEEQGRAAIEDLISSRFDGRTNLHLLDLATGPGRLLSSLVGFGETVALDGSQAMLQVAARRNLPNIRFVHGDVFTHDLSHQFHVVTCGRLLRHFEYPDRRLLYRRFRSLLREDGIGIVEVPNRVAEFQIRDANGWENYHVYDVFWTLNEFREELKANGLRLVSFVSVGADFSGSPQDAEPTEYVVSFEKIGA